MTALQLIYMLLKAVMKHGNLKVYSIADYEYVCAVEYSEHNGIDDDRVEFVLNGGWKVDMELWDFNDEWRDEYG